MRAGARLATAAALALAVAAALAFLAGAVFAVERDLDDETWELTNPGSAVAGGREDVRSLRTRVAESLLAVGDDRSFREAVRLIEASRRPNLPTSTILTEHGEALVRLTRLARGGDATRGSRALNLIGVLYVEDAELDPGSAQRYRELAVEAFQQAALLDPGNEEAKFNLELLLSGGVTRREGTTGQTGFGSTGGAGSRPTGSGY